MGKLKELSENIDDLLFKTIDNDNSDGDKEIDEASEKSDSTVDLAAMKVLISLSLSLLKRMKGTYLSKFKNALSDMNNSMDDEIDRMSPKQEKEFHNVFMDKVRVVKNKILEEFGDDFLNGIEENSENTNVDE